jgi:hypothetical protein
MTNKFIKNIVEINRGLDLEFRLRNSYGNIADENKRKMYNQSRVSNFRNLYPSEINKYALAIVLTLHPIKFISCAHLAAEERKNPQFSEFV